MTRRELIFYAALALGLVSFGDHFVLERTIDAQIPAMQVRDDALHYAQMAKGEWGEVYQAYRYRVFVPLVARMLPSSALENLKLVTLASLAFSYFLTLVLCRLVGLDNGAAIVGLLLVFSSHANLYQFHNPYLADGAALFWITLTLVAIAAGVYWILILTTLIGVTTRESHLFLLPALFFMDVSRRNVAVLAVVTVGVLIVIRRVVGGAPDQLDFWPYVVRNLESEGRLSRLPAFLAEIYRSWDYLWVIGLLGLLSLPLSRPTRRILVAGGGLLLGAVATSLVATDTIRMFYALFPVMVIGCAGALSMFRGRAWWFPILFCMVIVAQLLMYYPSAIFNFNQTAGWQWRFALYILGLIVVLLMLYLRTPLRSSHQT